MNFLLWLNTSRNANLIDRDFFRIILILLVFITTGISGWAAIKQSSVS
jgi:hypothetical protein